MAKQKQAKPLFAVKQDFIDAVDNTINKVLPLIQAIEMAMKLGHLSEDAEPIIQKPLDDLRAALFETNN